MDDHETTDQTAMSEPEKRSQYPDLPYKPGTRPGRRRRQEGSSQLSFNPLEKLELTGQFRAIAVSTEQTGQWKLPGISPAVTPAPSEELPAQEVVSDYVEISVTPSDVSEQSSDPEQVDEALVSDTPDNADSADAAEPEDLVSDAADLSDNSDKSDNSDNADLSDAADSADDSDAADSSEPEDLVSDTSDNSDNPDSPDSRHHREHFLLRRKIFTLGRNKRAEANAETQSDTEDDVSGIVPELLEEPDSTDNSDSEQSDSLPASAAAPENEFAENTLPDSTEVEVTYSVEVSDVAPAHFAEDHTDQLPVLETEPDTDLPADETNQEQQDPENPSSTAVVVHEVVESVTSTWSHSTPNRVSIESLEDEFDTYFNEYNPSSFAAAAISQDAKAREEEQPSEEAVPSAEVVPDVPVAAAVSEQEVAEKDVLINLQRSRRRRLWTATLLQAAVAIAVGAVLFFVFSQLWLWDGHVIYVCLLAIFTALSLILVICRFEKVHDLFTLLLAVGAAIVITFGPLMIYRIFG